MPSPPTNTRNLLAFKRKELEEHLLEREPELMQEYIDVCSALAGIEKSSVKHVFIAHEYAGHRNAIDAIRAYLEKANNFADQEELVQAILDGGWAPNDKRRKWNIVDSIRYYASSHTNKKGDVIPARLAKRDGKVGLAEWENKQ